MNRFVLDASVSVCWCFENQATAYSERIFELMAEGSEARVPFLWPAEMASVLVLAERNKRIAPARVAAQIEAIGQWSIQVDAEGINRSFQQILTLAREYQLTTYDAAYLELAMRDALPLATLDQRLRRAARAVGVSLE